MSLTSRLFVCLLSFLFSFDCSVLTVYRRCCECTVSAIAAVTAVPMIILICFSIQLSISFARTFAIASVRHMARWLVGRCLLASQVACYVYYVHTALHTPCFVFHVRFWHSHVCDHDRVSYNSGEHTVTDVAATTTAQTIKPQTLYNGTHTASSAAAARRMCGGSTLAKTRTVYKFDGPTFPQNQFMFVIWRNWVVSSETVTKY